MFPNERAITPLIFFPCFYLVITSTFELQLYTFIKDKLGVTAKLDLSDFLMPNQEVRVSFQYKNNNERKDGMTRLINPLFERKLN